MPYVTVGKESGSGLLSALQFKWNGGRIPNEHYTLGRRTADKLFTLLLF
jgi:hypothetical protein